MSIALASGRRNRRHYRLRRAFIEAGSMVLGLVLLIWSLLPVYNMFLIALDPEEGEVEFSGNLYPPEVSLEAFSPHFPDMALTPFENDVGSVGSRRDSDGAFAGPHAIYRWIIDLSES